jgi:pimeloyl-ACP methyl ester carboxylesterase
MGNKNLEKEVLTPGSMQQAQRELLKFSGMNTEQIKIMKVKYDEDKDGNPLFINTIEVGELDLPVLVLIHGYGGSGALFYKALSGLAPHFRTLCIDIVGMGASSRPIFNPANDNEAD